MEALLTLTWWLGTPEKECLLVAFPIFPFFYRGNPPLKRCSSTVDSAFQFDVTLKTVATKRISLYERDGKKKSLFVPPAKFKE